jgi:hypothetical protein
LKNHQQLGPFPTIGEINLVSFGIHIQPPPLLEMDGEEKFEVAKILDSQVFGQHLEYLMYWHGYNVSKHM